MTDAENSQSSIPEFMRHPVCALQSGERSCFARPLGSTTPRDTERSVQYVVS